MVPFTIPRGDLPFSNGDYIYVKDLRKGISSGGESFEAFAVSGTEIKKISLNIDSLTPDEREIILKGCLINYYRA